MSDKFSAICLFLAFNVFTPTFADPVKYFVSRDAKDSETRDASEPVIVGPIDEHEKFLRGPIENFEDAEILIPHNSNENHVDFTRTDHISWHDMSYDLIGIIANMAAEEVTVSEINLNQIYAMQIYSALVYYGPVNYNSKATNQDLVKLMKSTIEKLLKLAQQNTSNDVLRKFPEHVQQFYSKLEQIKDDEKINFEKLAQDNFLIADFDNPDRVGLGSADN